MEKKFIFDQLKTTPKNAQKTIEAGRLAGYTDINPMWRIKRLTEVFGACGVGWKYEVINRQIIDGGVKYYEKGKGDTYRVETCIEKCAFIDILLFYKTDEGAWSEGVFGTGGSHYVSAEKYAPFTDNDCWKKALTDAIGNACKNLCMSADIYYEKDINSKYETTDDEDLFKKVVTKSESLKIVNASREKWGHQAAEKCGELLKTKYGVTSTLEVLQIYLPAVLDDIKNAD
jgi:hypothetical protein